MNTRHALLAASFLLFGTFARADLIYNEQPLGPDPDLDGSQSFNAPAPGLISITGEVNDISLPPDPTDIFTFNLVAGQSADLQFSNEFSPFDITVTIEDNSGVIFSETRPFFSPPIALPTLTGGGSPFTFTLTAFPLSSPSPYRIWGSSTPGQGATVPEPNSLAICGVVALGLLGYRRRKGD